MTSTPVRLVLCFDADDWVDWCAANRYQRVTPTRMHRGDDRKA